MGSSGCFPRETASGSVQGTPWSGGIAPDIPKILPPKKSFCNSMREGPRAAPAPMEKGTGKPPKPPAPQPLHRIRTLLAGAKPLKAGPGRARAASRASILIGGSAAASAPGTGRTGGNGHRERPGGGGVRREGRVRERSRVRRSAGEPGEEQGAGAEEGPGAVQAPEPPPPLPSAGPDSGPGPGPAAAASLPSAGPGCPTGSGSGTGSVPSARGFPGLGGGSEEKTIEAEVSAGGEAPPEVKQRTGEEEERCGEKRAPRGGEEVQGGSNRGGVTPDGRCDPSGGHPVCGDHLLGGCHPTGHHPVRMSSYRGSLCVCVSHYR